ATSAPIASTGLARAQAGLARGDEVFQRRGGRDIDDAVDPLRAEMALERRHDVARGAVEIAAGGGGLAVFCQPGLHLFHGGGGFVPRGEKGGPAGWMGAGWPHRPMREAASVFQGNFSRGSRLRAGATSEWASTRSAGIRWRVKMLRQSAVTAATCRFGKAG